VRDGKILASASATIHLERGSSARGEFPTVSMPNLLTAIWGRALLTPWLVLP
jgi:hypothetical protein